MIMITKLNKLIECTKNNEYIRSIGSKRRPDPKDYHEDDEAQMLEQNKPRPLDEDEHEADDFDECDLSEEEEATRKKEERNKKMLERRKNRKSTKKVVS